MIRNALNLLRLTLTAMVALIMVSAAAQGFPERPIKILVPYSAGSTTDIIARLIATALAERTKQTVVVENRIGAGGIVGLKALQASPADGYTIGLVVSGNAVQPWLMKDMPFDVRKDFTPLSLMYVGQYLLMVPPELPPQNLAEFLAYLKSNPKKVFFGSSGAGTTTHLAGELLKQMGGVEMTHVPFKGSPEVFNAMFSGSVQAYFDLYGTAKPLIDAGKVRPLATSGKTRMASLPNLPALAEALPGFEVLVWTGFAVPNGTPPNVVAKLTTELRAVMQAPELRKRLADMGVEPGGGTSAAMAIFVAAEYEKWGKTIQAAGIKPE
jgi:tripartite-type tricarboxylate transporter receptor subunit TctC